MSKVYKFGNNMKTILLKGIKTFDEALKANPNIGTVYTSGYDAGMMTCVYCPNFDKIS